MEQLILGMGPDTRVPEYPSTRSDVRVPVIEIGVRVLDYNNVNIHLLNVMLFIIAIRFHLCVCFAPLKSYASLNKT